MRRKAISYQLSAGRNKVQRSAFSEKQNLFTYSPIHLFTNKKGATLVELIVTLAIFSIVITMIYSSFNVLLKQVTSERKVSKTELDVFNVSWPLIKEIETAGFGVPKTVTPIGEAAGVLTIYSTAAGDDKYAGAWSYVAGTSQGEVYTVTGKGVPTGQNVVIINILDKNRLGRTSVTTTAGASGNADYYNLDDSSSAYIDNIAYWTPYASAGDLEYYETKYSLTVYNPASSKPATCAELTQKLSRSSSKTTTEGYDPILDCVLSLEYRFGCINASTGNLTWQTGTSCGTSKLRLMKIGMIVQGSTQGASSPASIKLFEDLGGSLVSTKPLTSGQRNYRWRKVEQTITLKNLE